MTVIDEIIIQPAPIRKLLRQFCADFKIRKEGKHIPPDHEREFIRQQAEKRKNLLREIGKRIKGDNQLKYLSNLDIELALIGILRQTVGHRRKDNMLHISYFNDATLGCWETDWIQRDSWASCEEMLTSKELHPDIMKLIKKFLHFLNEKYSKNECTFKLIIPFDRTLWKSESITIDDRITIALTEKKLEIYGVYRGSNILCDDKIWGDLGFIIAILELERVIAKYKPNQSLITGGNKMGIEFKLPHVTGILSFAYLKSYYEDLVKQFDVGSTFTAHLGIFRILSYDFKEPILKTAIHFFNTDVHRWSSFKFLQYWSAIEVMLGSPDINIGSELKEAFYEMLPGEDPSLFTKLWKIRCGIVHDGELNVDTLTQFKIETLARTIFFAVFNRTISSA